MTDTALSVRLERRPNGTIAHAAFHGEKTLNVVNADILRAATTALEALCADPEVRVIVLASPDLEAMGRRCNSNVVSPGCCGEPGTTESRLTKNDT